MPRLLRPTLLAASLLVSATAQAQTAVKGPEWLALASVAVEAIDGPPKEEFKAKYKPVVLADFGLAVGDAGSAYGVPIRVVNRDELRAEQLAYFIAITRVEIDGDGAKVLWERPSSGHIGNLVLARQDGQWKVTGHRKMHSSDGARQKYGALFAGIECRDGTEMSQRWNHYHSFVQAIKSGKQFDHRAPVAAVCPGTEFPEVAEYRSEKAKAQ